MAADRDVDGVVVRLDISPSSHPSMIAGDSPGARLGRATLETIYSCYGKINDLAGQVKSKELLAASAQPFAERAIASAGRAMETLTAQLSHLDGEIATAITSSKNSPQAIEVRAYWRAQKTPLRDLGDRFKAGDETTISAVLSAPAYLSGLSEKNQAALRLLAAGTLVPDKVAARAETDVALERVRAAADDFTETIAGRLREWRDRDAALIQETLK